MVVDVGPTVVDELVALVAISETRNKNNQCSEILIYTKSKYDINLCNLDSFGLQKTKTLVYRKPKQSYIKFAISLFYPKIFKQL